MKTLCDHLRTLLDMTAAAESELVNDGSARRKFTPIYDRRPTLRAAAMSWALNFKLPVGPKRNWEKETCDDGNTLNSAAERCVCSSYALLT